MKTLHKNLAAILFALLAVTFFAACSSDSDDGSISAGYLANGATWTASIGNTSCGTFVFKFDRTVTVDIDLSGLAELSTSELAEAFYITNMSNPMLSVLPTILKNFTYSGTGNYYIEDSEDSEDSEDLDVYVVIEDTIDVGNMEVNGLYIILGEDESGVLTGIIYVEISVGDYDYIQIPITLTK